MKKGWQGTNTIILSLAVIGIFIVLTLFLGSVDHLKFDWTKNKQFTLAKQTTDTLKNLKTEIKITLFASGSDNITAEVKGVLQEYDRRSDFVELEIINPDKKPTIAARYQVSRNGTVIFEVGEKQERVESDEIIAPGPDQMSYEFRGEQKFTQAIINLTNDNKSTLYFVAGHQEMPADAMKQFRDELSNEGYSLKDINLVREGKVPTDADALLFVGPITDLTDAELKAVSDYAKADGKLFVGLGFSDQLDTWKNWDKLLKSLGVRKQKAVVMELQQSMTNDPLAILPYYVEHPITDKLLESDFATVMPGVLALATDETTQDPVARPILKTSDSAYGKTDLTIFQRSNITMTDIERSDADFKGPLEVAYAVESKDEKPKAIVVGNSLFLSDDFFGQQGNRDFALNSIGWIAENENALTIRPRLESVQQAVITPGQAQLIFYGTVIGIPLLLLITAALIWWRRRKA